ncbi:MAG: transketolase C-terminal domain-containing protein [Erysipelotrichaceae bacterium]
MTKIANRIAYGNSLVKLAEKHDFYVMDADLSKATGTKAFYEKYPERFINVGIAEQNLMATAAGLSSCGKPVFASTFAMFGAGRAYEQIRNSIAYTNANVKIICTHAGVLIGEDGASHQCIEDLSLMRTIPNMIVEVPSDAFMVEKMIEASMAFEGPFYARMGRQDLETIYDESLNFEIGKAIKLKSGKDVHIIACGELVKTSLDAREILLSKGIDASVIDMHTIKPIDKDMLEKCIESGKLIVSVEDHNVIGGLGSAIAEVIAEKGRGKLARIGLQDEFGCSGKVSYLQEYYSLTAEKIAERIEREMR